jgi:ABC-type protease/lipase transport system fused ATPase/permease subunit
MNNIFSYNSSLNLLKIVKIKVIIIFILTIIINSLGIVVAFFSMQVFDKVINSASVETLLYLGLIALISIFFANYFCKIRIETILNLSDIVSKYFIKNIKFNCNIKQTVNLLREVKKIRFLINQNYFLWCFEIAFSSLYLLVIYFVQPLLIILTIFILILNLIVEYYCYKKNINITENNEFIQNNYNNAYSNIFKNPDLYCFNKAFVNLYYRFLYLNNDSKIIEKNYFYIHNSNYHFIKNFRLFISIISTIFCSYLVIINEISIGTIIAYSIILFRFLDPYFNFFINKKNISDLILSFNKVLKEINIKSREINFLTNDLEIDSIKIDNIVCYLKNLDKIFQINSLEIVKGDIIAIISNNYEEQILLANLILNIHKPKSGIIKINNNNIKNIDFNKIDNFLTIFDDSKELFEGDVMQNISKMIYEPNMDDCNKLISKLGFEIDIGSLEYGLKTNIRDLNSHQKRIVNIISNFYQPSKILYILNSNLIYINKQIKEYFEEIANSKKHIIFLINPSKNFINKCNKIIIFNEDKVNIINNNIKNEKDINFLS